MRKLLILTGVLLLCSELWAQQYPDRSYIRRGNREYERGNYVEAANAYMKAKDVASGSVEADFNYSNSLYKQERYQEAEQAISAIETGSGAVDAKLFYNLGNSLFRQRKFQEAVDAYKKSLRINPADNEAKFNLAYAQKMLEQEQNDQNKDNKDNQDKQDQQDENQNKSDQGEDKEKKDDKGEPQDEEGNGQNEPKPTGMSKDEVDRILDAMQSNEDHTQDQVDAIKAQQQTNNSGKNW